MFVFFLLICEFHEERLGLIVHLSAPSGAHGRVHHAPEETGFLTHVAHALEHQREVQKILDLFVVRSANFLEWRLKLEPALLKHQAHVNLRQHLVQCLQPAMVLILERLVQLVIPVDPPRALQIFAELTLKVGKD